MKKKTDAKKSEPAKKKCKFKVGQTVKFLQSARDVGVSQSVIGKPGKVTNVDSNGRCHVSIAGSTWWAYEKQIVASNSGYEWGHDKI